MRYKIYFLSLFTLLFIKGLAQIDPPQLPQLLPVTPTAGGLIKAGMGDIKKSTGAVTAGLPLYELKSGNYKLPVSVNYFSQGSKVEEQCSRVGYGWSLSAGGVITRRIMGMPDEHNARLPIPASLTEDSYTVLDYFESGKTTGSLNDSYDTQPDEFNFSFNGYNGKFVLNDNFEPVLISTDNLKITVNSINSGVLSNITIVTPDGVKYIFGNDAIEETQHYGTGASDNFPTAFYLSDIILPAGGGMTFEYDHITTRSVTGFTETVSAKGNCTETMSDNYYNQVFSSQHIQNIACVLRKINTTEGVSAEFEYEPVPDLSGDKRLKKFYVLNQNNKAVCSYDLTYQGNGGYLDYPAGGTTYAYGKNTRFFLSKITQADLGSVTVPQAGLDYILEYYGTGNTPNNVFAQDYFGFANGRLGGSLIPPNTDLTTNAPAVSWGDRTPEWTAALDGMLKSITYPTKGKESFTYESNTISTQEEIANFVNHHALMHSGIGGPQYTYYFGGIHKPQNVNITYTIEDNFGNQPYPCDPFSGKICLFTITDITTNTIIISRRIQQGETPYVYPLQIIPEHNYKIVTRVDFFASCWNLNLDFTSDNALPGLQPVEKQAGGVRVKQIQKTDAFGAAINKYYFYGSYASPGVSTGAYTAGLQFASPMRKWVIENDIPRECNYTVYSSNGIYNLCNLDNSHIGYKNIIEADDPLFLNGATEYTFYDPTVDNTGMPVRGDLISNPPGGQVPTFAGLLYKVKVYSGTGALKASEEHNYEIITPPLPAPVKSIYIRKDYTVAATSSVWIPYEPIAYNKQFDVREVLYTPKWVRQYDTKSTSYDNSGNPFVTNTAYTYGTDANVLPAATSSTDSKGATLQSIKKYPTDFPSDPVLAAMAAANMISPVIEAREKRGLTETGRTNVIYQSNGAPGGGFQPLKIQQKQLESNAMEDRILFSAYDDKGNLKEVSKALDGKISYLWDYSQSLVVAEVKNSAKEDIAYTSFEAGSKGNFTYAGAAIADLTAPTGQKAYELGGGAITAPAAAALSKPYIISYWSNSGAKSVTGSSSLITGRSAGGWTYYEHAVSSLAAGTAISGSGLIDELRMYPSDALMTTYTYEPLVGVTSQCDVNNRIGYYEYDGLNRLVLIRDQNKNIAKKICYSYAGMPEDCGAAAPLFTNLAASGSFTRNDCPAGYTGSTVTYTVAAGTYSAYTQAAADLLAANDVAAGGQAYANTAGDCTPVSLCGTCTDINKKCINNVCETGTMVYITSVKKKNQTLWTCSYVYCFSDHTSSAVQSFQDTLPCVVDVCP